MLKIIFNVGYMSILGWLAKCLQKCPYKAVFSVSECVAHGRHALLVWCKEEELSTHRWDSSVCVLVGGWNKLRKGDGWMEKRDQFPERCYPENFPPPPSLPHLTLPFKLLAPYSLTYIHTHITYCQTIGALMCLTINFMNSVMEMCFRRNLCCFISLEAKICHLIKRQY